MHQFQLSHFIDEENEAWILCPYQSLHGLSKSEICVKHDFHFTKTNTVFLSPILWTKRRDPKSLPAF
jgi:hypothetical protein